MKTIIAEKPSVAREIALIVGATEREEGYFTGNGYNVTWAFGHLVQPALPEGYGIRGFHPENLPIIPQVFTLVPRQVKTDKDGNRLNLIKLDDFPSTDEKAIGKKLQEIAKNATTGGQYVRVGELYRFPIKVISETSLASGLATIENRFVIEGHYKYTFDNGHLAMADPKVAATNFLNALEKIPGIISQRKEKNESLAKDIPQLQELAGKVWKKEDELKQLKSELFALDRKIQLELAPPTPVSEGQEHKNNTDVPKMEKEITGTPDKDFIREHIVQPPTKVNKGLKI